LTCYIMVMMWTIQDHIPCSDRVVREGWCIEFSGNKGKPGRG